MGRAMKDSGIEWIGEIPSDWTCCKQKYVIQLINGRAFADTEFEEDGKYPILRVGNLGTNTVWYTSSLKLPEDKYCDDGDLLYSWSMSYAPVIWHGGKVIYHYHIWKVRLNDKIERNFAFYYLSALTDALKSEIHETTMGFITMGVMNNSWIAFPSKDEQQRIARYLSDRIESLSAVQTAIEQEVQDLEQYRRSIIHEAVTKGLNPDVPMKDSGVEWIGKIPEDWETIPIKYLFTIVKDIAGKLGYDVLSVTQKGLKIRDISNNEGQLASDYSKYQLVAPGDYVMNHMDLLTGWVDQAKQVGVTSPDYRVFRLKDPRNYNGDFFKYVMQNGYSSRVFFSLGNGVSRLGRWRLQTSTFKNIAVPVPPLKVQRQIASYLDQKCFEIDVVIATKRQQLETLSQYKKSLIYECVTGKREVPA